MGAKRSWRFWLLLPCSLVGVIAGILAVGTVVWGLMWGLGFVCLRLLHFVPMYLDDYASNGGLIFGILFIVVMCLVAAVSITLEIIDRRE